MKIIKILLLVLILAIVSAEKTIAERGSRLATGLTFNEVIKVKGFPLSSDTHETSRLVIWSYKNSTVFFKDGRTTSKPQNWKPVANPQTKPVTLDLAKTKVKSSLTQTDVDEILSAIPNDKGGGRNAPESIAPDISEGTGSSN